MCGRTGVLSNVSDTLSAMHNVRFQVKVNSCCTSDVHLRCCFAAQKEEEELQTQKEAGTSKAQQQRQQPQHDTQVDPVLSSSADPAKATASVSPSAGGINLASRSQQGMAEKAKEVRLSVSFLLFVSHKAF